MTSKPWPCMSCKYLSPLDSTGFYHCEYHINEAMGTIPDKWNKIGRQLLGTKKEVEGSVEKTIPNCDVYELRTRS